MTHRANCRCGPRGNCEEADEIAQLEAENLAYFRPCIDCGSAVITEDQDEYLCGMCSGTGQPERVGDVISDGAA